jgi:ABC-type dipeptide/oligopeptide/nickel transport system permease subunit
LVRHRRERPRHPRAHHLGARASLTAGVISVSIAVCVGAAARLFAGFVGGWIDALISRIVDAMLACPFLILAIALARVPRTVACSTR